MQNLAQEIFINQKYLESWVSIVTNNLEKKTKIRAGKIYSKH